MKQWYEIIETVEYGLILRVMGTDLADQLDDFLTEKCYVLYNMKFDQNFCDFSFGQVCEATKLKLFLDAFQKENVQLRSQIS
jgi:hypothetical protein